MCRPADHRGDITATKTQGLKILPRPGWTTPAEFALVSATLGVLRPQVDAAETLKQKLVEASRTISI